MPHGISTLETVISRIDLRGDAFASSLRDGGIDRDLLPRAELDVEAALEKVRPICDDVRHRGTAALIEYAQRFDGVTIDRIRVPQEALGKALDELDPAVRAALEESVRRARMVHGEQRRTDHTTHVVPGGTVTERWVPVERVGLYVPGGRAVYPSSVVMNVVPAQEAGVALAGRRLAPAGRLRRAAAPHHPGRLRPAGRRRGVRGRRRAGGRDVRVRH